MKKILCMAAAMFTVLGFSLVSVSSASATESGPPAPPTCVRYDNGTTLCGASAASKATSTVSMHDADRATAHGKTVVYYIQAHGATQRQMQGRHYRLKHGMWLMTSWKLRNGTVIWHKKWFPAGYVLVRGKDGYWHDPKCWNKEVGNLPHARTRVGRKIYGAILVRSAVSATANSVTKSTGTGWASASCAVNGATAYAQSEYSFDVYAKASATATASTWFKAKEAARNALHLSKKEADTWAKARAQTLVKATASATANASCSTTKTTPPQPVPPTCQSVYGPGYTGNYPYCTKDGTTTPPPPSDAPGPNPPPSGGTGDPGSNQCYDETTGQPVDPAADGTCPPGSFGA